MPDKYLPMGKECGEQGFSSLLEQVQMKAECYGDLDDDTGSEDDKDAVDDGYLYNPCNCRDEYNYSTDDGHRTKEEDEEATHDDQSSDDKRNEKM